MPRISSETFTLTNKAKAKFPHLAFVDMKDKALGKDYMLSLVIVNAKEIRLLNKIYRNIDKATDILSFPLSKKEGEIYMCTTETRKMAKDFERTYENFFAYLFIHGLIHLKGFDHGSTMERIEAQLRAHFNLDEKPHNNRH